jgi:hypothetical protein
MNDVAQILSRIETVDAGAAARLLPLVYDELRKLAAGLARRAIGASSIVLLTLAAPALLGGLLSRPGPVAQFSYSDS